MKKCPPGVICFENVTIFFIMIIIFITIIIYFNSQKKYHTQTNENRGKTNKIN